MRPDFLSKKTGDISGIEIWTSQDQIRIGMLPSEIPTTSPERTMTRAKFALYSLLCLSIACGDKDEDSADDGPDGSAIYSSKCVVSWCIG